MQVFTFFSRPQECWRQDSDQGTGMSRTEVPQESTHRENCMDTLNHQGTPSTWVVWSSRRLWDSVECLAQTAIIRCYHLCVSMNRSHWEFLQQAHHSWRKLIWVPWRCSCWGSMVYPGKGLVLWCQTGIGPSWLCMNWAWANSSDLLMQFPQDKPYLIGLFWWVCVFLRGHVPNYSIT